MKSESFIFKINSLSLQFKRLLNLLLIVTDKVNYSHVSESLFNLPQGKIPHTPSLFIALHN